MNNFMSERPGFYEEVTGGARGISMSSFSSAAGNSHLPESSHNTNIGGGDEDSDDHLLHRPGGNTEVEREHMFDKVVTPSDVGKLNRLVIPKQHAEKYFPLDSSTNEKGLLLNFEDRNGKPWRFRYSYWNSSQSYVMTKGWSRFVKEKKLDAGDVVSFQRGVGDAGKDRLFIDWRRRPDLLPPPNTHQYSSFQYRSGSNPWNPLFLNPLPPREYSPYQNNQFPQHHHHHQNQNQYGINYGYNSSTTVVNGNPCPPGSVFYLSRPGDSTTGSGAGSGFIVAGRAQQEGVVVNQMGGTSEQMVYESVPVVQGKAAAKRLRLFGVNMDCPIPAESDHDCEMLSNSTVPLHQYFPSSPTSSSSSFFPNSLQLRPNYSDNNDNEDDKGKGSISLDLDI